MMLKRASLFLVLAALTSAAQAQGNTGFAILTAIDVRNDGNFLITVNTDIAGTPPGCATDQKRMSGNANTPGGNLMLANAMSAFPTHSTVVAQGTGLCSEYGNVESLVRLMQVLR